MHFRSAKGITNTIFSVFFLLETIQIPSIIDGNNLSVSLVMHSTLIHNMRNVFESAFSSFTQNDRALFFSLSSSYTSMFVNLIIDHLAYEGIADAKD